MSSKIIINKDINNSNVNSDYGLSKYYEEIFKEIFDIKGNIKIDKIRDKNIFKYVVYNEENLVCSFEVKPVGYLYDYVLNVFCKNYSYHYYIDEELGRLILKLGEYQFDKDDKHYRMLDFDYDLSIDITKDNKGLAIELEEKNINSDIFKTICCSFDLDDSIEYIYNRLKVVSSCENIKIKKYIKLNSCDSREVTTDLLKVKNGDLLDYLTNVSFNLNGKEYKYVLKKSDNNYSINCNDNSIIGLRASQFLLKEQMNFLESFEDSKPYSKVMKKN